MQVPLAEVQVRGKGDRGRTAAPARHGYAGSCAFAKDQAVYDFLAARQEAGRMIKTYCAFVEPTLSPEIDNGHGFDVTELSRLKKLSVAQRRMAVQEQIAAQERIAAKLPLTLESQFRNFGPGAKGLLLFFCFTALQERRAAVHDGHRSGRYAAVLDRWKRYGSSNCL